MQIMAIDGVDRVGKSTLCRVLAQEGNFPIIDSSIMKNKGDHPGEMSYFSDVPKMIALKEIQRTIFDPDDTYRVLLDRSIISALTYCLTGLNPEGTFEKLAKYVGWYKNNVTFAWIYFTNLENILGRSDGEYMDTLSEDQEKFGEAYEIFEITPMIIPAELEVDEKVRFLAES